jgi:uncharacterized membrane protein YbhN (UPF0104 family)
MPKKILLVFRYGFFLALGLVLAWISIRSISQYWDGIKQSLAHARYFLLVPIILLYLLSHVSRAIRWKIMIEPLGYSPLTLNVFFSVMIGYLVNLAIPRLGEVVRCTFLGRHEKIPIEKLLGTIIVERAFDMVCLLVVFFLAYTMQAKALSDYAIAKYREGGSHGNHYLLIGILVALALVTLTFIFLYRRHKTNKVVVFVEEMVLGLWEGITRIRYMKNKGWFLFHTVLIWTLYYACTRLGLMSLKELDGLGTAQAFSVLSMGSIAMIIAPGGLGAYPLMVQYTLMFYHIPEGIALGAGYILWVVPTVLIIIGGVISFVGIASPGKTTVHEKLPAYQSQDVHT